jgi:phenylalanyl-tRNA synthetase beta chain
MKISTRWLSDYIDLPNDTEKLVDALTMAGIEVESVDEIGSRIKNVVTVQVEQVRPHPNADRLKVCDVTDGQNTYTVVCGAPNVRVGMVTALAIAGAELPAGQVRKVNIKGIKSAGMLVSRRELGISEDHSGIFEVPDSIGIGRELTEALNLHDTVLDISVTPNRPDWLSVIGVARELAAAFGGTVQVPHVPFENVGGAIDISASVQIDAPDLCPRYCGILVEDVKIGPSPFWLEQRLDAIGVRSINNIVDITNFVLHEVGQPLHAFDSHFLTDQKIIVRRCRPNEKIVTLDDKEHNLPVDSLLICDAEKPVALAGIMGGQNSLVTDDTVDIFIESAYFNPPNIRTTGKTVGLSTDSSYRFERGIDVNGVPYGLHRAARLMEKLAGGRVVEGYIDNYPGKKAPAKVTLRPSRANKLLGTNISDEQMAALLESIQLSVTVGDDLFTVDIPTFRVDIEREVDLIEEVARLYGFDNIQATLPTALGVTPTISDSRKVELATRDILMSQGMAETLNFAFTNPKKLDVFKDTPGAYVKLKNPLNEEYSALRDTLLGGLCQNTALNLNRQAKSVQLFEIRKVYQSAPVMNQLPNEPLFASGIITGRREPEGWAQSSKPVDFYDLKGICEELFENLGVAPAIEWVPGNASCLGAQCNASLLYRGNKLGIAGQLDKSVTAYHGINSDAFVFEINLDVIKKDVSPINTFQKLSRFPVTTRDMAFLVGQGVRAEQIQETIVRIAPELIQEVICFDVYAGDKVKRNEKSLAFSIRMQKLDGEVTDIEADRIVRKTVGIVMSRFDAKLRE